MLKGQTSIPIPISGVAFAGAYDDIPDLVHVYEIARRTLVAYEGSLVRLRRSSDNAELDFGFVENGDLDTAAITTWLGGASGLVVTVYDQVGSDNLGQGTAGNQSTYNANVKGGRPGIEQGTTSKGLTDTSAALTQPISIYILAQLGAGAVNDNVSNILAGDSANLSFIYDRGTSTPDTFSAQAGAVLGGPSSDGAWHLWAVTFDGASSSLRLDGVGVATGNAGTNNYTGIVLGNSAAMTSGWVGYIGALIVADPAHDTTERDDMETAVDDYWSVIP